MQGNAMQGNMTHLTRELAVLWDELFEAVASITSAAAKIDVLATGLQGASAEGIHAQTANIVKACDFRNATAERIAKIAGELVRVDQFGRNRRGPPGCPAFPSRHLGPAAQVCRGQIILSRRTERTYVRTCTFSPAAFL